MPLGSWPKSKWSEYETENSLLVVAVWCCVIAAQAQKFSPPQNKNAALRYWAAFAEMKDQSIDDATAKLMEDVLNGRAAWDEQKLGKIVEENAYAVRAMQRATALPECNWGLDYSLGDAMPLAHLSKARVLARLNALYGVRQMDKGEVEPAINTWLAGLRFAQDVEKDLSLIGLLSAKPAYLANLHLLAQAVQKGLISTELHNRIKAGLQQLPAEGLNWSEPIAFEAWADTESLKRLAHAKDFQETYKESFNKPPAESEKPPSPADIADFQAYMRDMIAAFQRPPDQTQERMTALAPRLKNMNPTVQAIVPNYQRLNDTRKEVSSELQTLHKALDGQK